MAFPKSSPAITYLALIFLITLFSFTTTTAASRKSNSKTSENLSERQLIHAVTGNLSAITARGGAGGTTFSFFCRTKRDCAFAGPNATCWNYQCICDLGYLSINAYCTKVTCSRNYDCLRYFYNTRCGWDYSCVCNYGTHLDPYSQSCLTGDDDLLALKISLPISLLFVAILVACCCCCCCKRRRRRQQEARLLANPADPNGALYQAVGGGGGGSSSSAYNYQGGYQNPTLIYPSLNQAPPPYNPAYVQGGQTTAATAGWNLPPTTKS
ncbi:hypothetical protein TYRP_011214 [Tyrophagus putrescentiae]|nr:hypothetical protein TYRP_011214 [Tyrophagus putrescentiae]